MGVWLVSTAETTTYRLIFQSRRKQYLQSQPSYDEAERAALCNAGLTN